MTTPAPSPLLLTFTSTRRGLRPVVHLCDDDSRSVSAAFSVSFYVAGPNDTCAPLELVSGRPVYFAQRQRKQESLKNSQWM
jgi:hypothetical protein